MFVVLADVRGVGGCSWCRRMFVVSADVRGVDTIVVVHDRGGQQPRYDLIVVWCGLVGYRRGDGAGWSYMLWWWHRAWVSGAGGRGGK